MTSEELAAAIKRHLDWCPGSSSPSPRHSSPSPRRLILERLRFLSLALAGEAGEVANVVKKQWRDGSALDVEKLHKELADVGAYYLMLLRHCNLGDMEPIILAKIKEVEQRPEWLAHQTRIGGIK